MKCAMQSQGSSFSICCYCCFGFHLFPQFCIFLPLGKTGGKEEGGKKKMAYKKQSQSFSLSVGRRLILCSSSRKMRNILVGSRVGGWRMSPSAFCKHTLKRGVPTVLPPWDAKQRRGLQRGNRDWKRTRANHNLEQKLTEKMSEDFILLSPFP